MSSPDLDDLAHVAAAERKKAERDLRQILLSGIALTVPFFVTLLILGWALDMAASALTPLAEFLVAVGPFESGNAIGPIEDGGLLLVQVLSATLVFGLIFAVGLAAQHGPETNLGRRIDLVMEDIPGIGSIYTSVERMSDVLVEGDTESFQEVKVVEFPADGSFAVAFLTAESPSVVEDAVGEADMVTVFVPMAPNPVMGGHLVTLRQERVHDVDMTVEEGMEAIITTGITIDETAEVETDVTG